MLFKKDEINNLEELKAKAPDLFESLVAEARSGSDERIAELEAKILKTENSAKIKAFGEKLNLQTLAKELIEEDTPYNEACEALLNAYESDDEEEFLESSSSLVGADGGSDEGGFEPKTFGEAINFIAERESISKAEASEKAKSEFNELFIKTVS